MSEKLIKDEEQKVKVVPMADISATLYPRYLDGGDVLDYVITLTPRSKAAKDNVDVMLALMRRGKATACLDRTDTGMEILIRTRPHWRQT